MDNVISINPDICNGKPVFRGTRITVQSVFDFLSAGDSVDEVLAQYPVLKRSDIEAAFSYASRLTGNSVHLEPVW